MHMYLGFKIDFLKNEALNEKMLFFLSYSSFHVESPSSRLYHQLPNSLALIVSIVLSRVFRFCLWHSFQLRVSYFFVIYDWSL